MKKALLPLILALLLPHSVQAQDQEDPCAEAETTIALSRCLQQVFEAADAELNRVYQAA